MIKVKLSTENTAVAIAVKIGHPLPDDMELLFWKTGITEVEARLLAAALKKAIEVNMEDIRRTSYLRGWRDKASRKMPKSMWFPVCTSVLPWEKEKKP